MDGRKPRRQRRSGMRVLVADDSQDTARMMRVLLRGRGYEVKLAFAGREAIEVAEGFGPEVILLEFDLPDMDSCELATRLRRENCFGGTTIIVASGYDAEEDRPRSEESGIDCHFVRPPSSIRACCHSSSKAPGVVTPLLRVFRDGRCPSDGGTLGAQP